MPPLTRLLLIALLCLPVSGRAVERSLKLGELLHQSWGPDSGIPQISVSAIARDAEGLMWVGTENGLARFDGQRFETFRQVDTPALQSSRITRLHYDRQQRLWIGTTRGLAQRDAQGSFKAVMAEDGEPGQVNGFAEDASGTLYVATERGLFAWHDTELRRVDALHRRVTALTTQGESLWFTTQGALHRRQPSGTQSFVLPAAWAEVAVNEMAWSGDTLWLSSSGGLLRWRNGVMSALALETVPISLRGLAVDETGNVWVGSDRALYRLQDGAVVERLSAADSGVLRWPVTILPLDGGLWLGSQTEGLQHFWPGPLRRLSVEEGLVDPFVWSYAEDGERLLMGTNSGVAVLENERIRPLIAAADLPQPVAYSLLLDTAKRLWVGTRAGLARFTREGQPLDVLSTFAGLRINGLLQARDESVWVASSGGLFQVTAQGAGDTVRSYGAEQGLDTPAVRFVLQASDGLLWLGTESGLYRQHGERFENLPLDGQTDVFITSLVQLADGRLVAGSYDQGLYVLQGDVVTHLSLAQGLPFPNAFFLGVVESWLLVGGADGAYRLPLAALTTDAPLPVDMLLVSRRQFQGRSAIRCCNGAGNGKGLIRGDTAWLPSLDGAIRVTVNTPGTPPPAARVNQLAQGRQSLDLVDAMLEGGLPRNAVIDYSANDYCDPEQLQFRYRLTGFDQEWQEVGTRRSAIYTNLPPGSFTFEVQARRPFERWGPSAALRLVVPRQFHETWPFRLLCLAAAMLAAALLLRWRLHRLETQKAALEALVMRRTQDLSQSKAALEIANEALRTASLTDALTGLHNRRHLDEELPGLLARFDRQRLGVDRISVVGVLLVDIDHFKSINDRFGHGVGDAVLQSVGLALKQGVRTGEMVVRWGGEEFLVIVEVSDRQQVDAAALRLHRVIAESCRGVHTSADQLLPPLSASIGCASLPLALESNARWQDALEIADFCLYRAKRSGRNRCITLDVLQPEVVSQHTPVSAQTLEQWLASGVVNLREV